MLIAQSNKKKSTDDVLIFFFWFVPENRVWQPKETVCKKCQTLFSEQKKKKKKKKKHQIVVYWICPEREKVKLETIS